MIITNNINIIPEHAIMNMARSPAQKFLRQLQAAGRPLAGHGYRVEASIASAERASDRLGPWGLADQRPLAGAISMI